MLTTSSVSRLRILEAQLPQRNRASAAHVYLGCLTDKCRLYTVVSTVTIDLSLTVTVVFSFVAADQEYAPAWRRSSNDIMEKCKYFSDITLPL